MTSYGIPVHLFEHQVTTDSRPQMDLTARLAFAMTLSRAPVAVFMALLILTEHLTAACWIVVIAVFVDITDGIVFNFSPCSSDRHFRQRRRILDAIMDRILISTTLFVSVAKIHFPLGIYLILMCRELLLAISCAYPYLAKKTVLSANLPSRAATTLIGVQFILFAATGAIPAYLTILFCFLAVAGLSSYLYRPKYI